MQGAMPWMFISTGQASDGGSGTSKELSNSMATLYSLTRTDLFGGDLRHPTVRLRPARGVVQEFFDLGQFGRVELAAGLGVFEHVPPGAQMMQFDVEVGQDFFAVRVDAVIE